MQRIFLIFDLLEAQETYIFSMLSPYNATNFEQTAHYYDDNKIVLIS